MNKGDAIISAACLGVGLIGLGICITALWMWSSVCGLLVLGVCVMGAGGALLMASEERQ